MNEKKMLMPDAENTLEWFANVIKYGGETGDVFFIWVSDKHLELVIPSPIDIMYWRIEALVEGPDNNILLDPKTPDISVHNLFNKFMDRWDGILSNLRANKVRIIPEAIADGLLHFTAEKGLDRTLIMIRRFESIGELEKTLNMEILGDLVAQKAQRRGSSHA